MLRFFLELLGLLAAGSLGFLIVPGIVPKVGAMTVFAGLYFYFVMMRHFGDSEVIIEEVFEGRIRSLR
jgi:hypothetical protein